MRIVFSSRKYDGVAGGVERMSIELMNAMASRGHHIGLVSFDQLTGRTFYPLNEAIEWARISIGDPARRANASERMQRFLAIRRFMSRFRPDVAIGFQQGAFVSTAIATIGTRIPIIAAERNAPQRFEHLKDGHGKNFQFQSFRLARCVTIQFDSYRDHYPDFVRKKMVTIPNPVRASADSAAPAGLNQARKRLLCVARLSFQKNQCILIDAFARLALHFPDWDLVLVGDGEERAALEERAASAAPAGRVRFEGAQTDVGRYYRAAHLFCLPSRWEGFPNVLAEAMTCGLPAVGFADCAGVNALIEHEVTGLLAQQNDAATLAQTLAVLMADPGRRVAMGERGRASLSHYAPEAIFDRWERLFEKVSGL